MVYILMSFFEQRGLVQHVDCARRRSLRKMNVRVVVSCRSLRWRPRCIDGCTDRFREKSDFPHRSLCIGFLQTWRTRSCRHSLPRYFHFGFTNEIVDPLRERGQSHCLGPRNFRGRNKEASEGKYNLVFPSPEKLFGSHCSSIFALKNKIQAVFIDEVQCGEMVSVCVCVFLI